MRFARHLGQLSLFEEGWLRDQENVAQHPWLAQTGWVVFQPQQKFVELHHHPVRSIEEASRYFVKVASTPPRRGGEIRHTTPFGQQPTPASRRDQPSSGTTNTSASD